MMKSAPTTSERINISIPIEVLKLLDEVVPPKKRSQFIAEAIMQYANDIKRLRLREQLKEGYLANAESDQQIAEECSLRSPTPSAYGFPIEAVHEVTVERSEQEAYEKYVLEQDEGESN